MNQNSFGGIGISLKRGSDEPDLLAPKRVRYYYRLASESSGASEDDTESTYSCQGYETEIAQDTPDTDTKSEHSDFELEYEIASSDEAEHPVIDDLSSESDVSRSEAVMVAAAGAIAAVICDTSLDWLTDGEDSDSSSEDAFEANLTDFCTCLKCKSQNINPLYRYCQKCFKERKTFYPPRPKGRRKRRKTKESKLSSTSSQPSSLSENFDLESHESSTTEQAGTTTSLSKITPPSSPSLTSPSEELSPQNIQEVNNQTEYKSDTNDINSNSNGKIETQTLENVKETNPNEQENASQKKPFAEYEELCIMCNVKSKDSIFLHGKIGHMCCCYKCAKKCWIVHKKCPICNLKIYNIVKVFK